jgi:membrane-associated phospholipid phosphatase
VRRPLNLPVISTARGKVTAAAGTVLVCAAMYFIPQHLHRGQPLLLPMTALDRWVPFWPASGLIYFAVFPLLLGTYVAIRDLHRATCFLYACLFAQTIGMACFLLWPTQYPRELFDLPPTASMVAATLVKFCRSADAPVNCLPSLHVSTVVLCIGALRGSRLFVPAIVAGIPLAASTLTFKQHYLVDVIAGALLGLLACLVFFRRSDAEDLATRSTVPRTGLSSGGRAPAER